MRKNTLTELRRLNWLRLNQPKTTVYVKSINPSSSGKWYKYLIENISEYVFSDYSDYYNYYYYTTKRPHRRIVEGKSKE